MRRVQLFSKYLGLPMHVGHSKNMVFNYIKDNVWKNLKGWKESCISFDGQSILIKEVAYDIPTY